MNKGNYAEDATINHVFNTYASTGAPVAPLTAFEADDVRIYKNGSATQKTTTNGITMTSPFDSVTGQHLLVIDTSVDTGDTSFWVVGSDYTVMLIPDTETVDGIAVSVKLFEFSIENRQTTANITEVNGAAVTLVSTVPLWGLS